jgi:lycopene elongase/hydratase (dihydrobisanhydrobacterioruberin-forming)
MNIHRLLTISRPRFWIYELGPYVVGIAAASQGEHHVWLLFPVLLYLIFFLYPANIYIYGINDIFDYETDKLNPKKVSYESLVEPHEWKKLWTHILIISAPFLLYALFTLPIPALVALLAFFFFAGFYSAKPIRAKARPVLDSIFSAGHYVATGVFSYILVRDLLDIDIAWGPLALCVAAGMSWALSMHAYSAVPDIEADKGAKLSTIATTLGKRGTIILCAFLYALASALVFQYIGIVSVVLGSVYLFLMAISLRTTEEQLFKVYTYFPTINTLSGMLIFFRLLLA